MKNLKILSLLIALVLVITNCSTNNSGKAKLNFEQILKEIKTQYAPDSRVAIIEVSIDEQTGSNGNIAVLKGKTTCPEIKEAFVNAYKKIDIDIVDSITILPNEELKGKIYGVATQSVINFRTSGKYSAESATQVMMGTPVKILEKNNGWTRAVTPEGYISWVTSGSLAELTQEEMESYNAAKKVIITTKYTTIYSDPKQNSEIVCDAVWGNIFIDLGNKGFWNKVALADGREGYVMAGDVQQFDKWLDSRNPTADNIIETAKQFIGVPYMWGGTSIKAVDCSGFTKSTYFLNGVVLARDASQQCYTGDDVDITNYINGTQTKEALSNLKKGDLIFFGTKATPEKKERITHVGIYIENGIFIHSATRVKINSLIPEDANYYSGSNRLVRAQRIIGNVDCNKGIYSISKLYK